MDGSRLVGGVFVGVGSLIAAEEEFDDDEDEEDEEVDEAEFELADCDCVPVEPAAADVAEADLEFLPVVCFLFVLAPPVPDSADA